MKEVDDLIEKAIRYNEQVKRVTQDEAEIIFEATTFALSRLPNVGMAFNLPSQPHAVVGCLWVGSPLNKDLVLPNGLVVGHKKYSGGESVDSNRGLTRFQLSLRGRTNFLVVVEPGVDEFSIEICCRSVASLGGRVLLVQKPCPLRT